MLAFTDLFFFFNDTATTEIYTLSLHDALPISRRDATRSALKDGGAPASFRTRWGRGRSEEHTSELQSHSDLVCRLLLEKKKNKKYGVSAIKKCDSCDTHATRLTHTPYFAKVYH